MVSGNRTDSTGTERLRRLALVVQYDGSGFNGWQIQNDGRTVQQEIVRALQILTGHPVHVTACGRTDAGVHALCQVVHFDCFAPLTLQRIAIGMNGILPFDVSVENVYHVKDDFHARYDPVCREYLYRIYNHPLRSSFVRNRAMWEHDPVDPDFMRAAGAFLVGEHDFTTFCKTSSAKDINTVRTIYSIDVATTGHYIDVTICGNAFLHNMIRSIIGTMLDLCRKGLPPDTMKELLAGRDRRIGGETVSADGLYLSKVIYNPPLESYPSAF
ncbi:MAG: tRNA pseudouridine(38-40) synthase TruA [Spirochaetota bacterium]